MNQVRSLKRFLQHSIPRFGRNDAKAPVQPKGAHAPLAVKRSPLLLIFPVGKQERLVTLPLQFLPQCLNLRHFP